MRALMYMLFGRMISKGRGQIAAGQSGVAVFDRRVNIRSTVLVNFIGPGPVVAQPQPFVVTVADGNFSVVLPLAVNPNPAPFVYVVFN